MGDRRDAAVDDDLDGLDDLVDPAMQRQADSALLEEDDPWAQDAPKATPIRRNDKMSGRSGFRDALAPIRTTLQEGVGSSSSAASPEPSRTRRRPKARVTSVYYDEEEDDDNGAHDEQTNGFAATNGGIAKDTDHFGYGGGSSTRRRVGYEDLTTIDWIFEYTKERQRLLDLRAGARGLAGEGRKLYDASQIWIVLVLTGLSAGLLAASIDIVSDWLGDLKVGYCHRGEGDGKFYLNKSFCCFGHDELAKCGDWTSWATLAGATSVAGRWLTSYFFYVAYSVLFATASALLVRQYAPYARQSGIPEIKTMLGGFVMQRFLGVWTLVTKSVGVVLSVSSGLWLGKEGPFVHIACCCANLWMRPWPALHGNEARKREVLSAAAAAGISVAFGAPIGGVLFSLEQLSYFFPDKTMWQSFVCAMVAAVTLQAVNPFRSGKLVLYEVTYSSGWHSFEMPPFVLLGLGGGLFGAAFVRLNMWIARLRRAAAPLRRWPVAEVAAFALLTALVNYPNVFMRAQSSELVHDLFAECGALSDDMFGICGGGGDGEEGGIPVAKTVSALLSAGFLGLLLSAVTFGLRIPAGIILPSMAMGALGGRAVGIVVEAAQARHPDWLVFSTCEPDVACVTPGVYAVVGAAAALAGISRMTVSTVVIMFELTGALTYVLPIMVAVLLSKWVADALTANVGIYESWINLNEYPYLGNPEDATVPDVYASQVMTPVHELATLSAVGHTVASLRAFLAAHPHRGFPVVAGGSSNGSSSSSSGGGTDDNVLVGYITRNELSYALKLATVEPGRLSRDAEVLFTYRPSNSTSSTRNTTTTTTTTARPGTLDMRPWMDQTPITLSSRSTLQLTVDMFLKLGIRNMLFCDRGRLAGLLTKKDLWYILSRSKGGGGDLAGDGDDIAFVDDRLGGGGSGSSSNRGRTHDNNDEDDDDEDDALARNERLFALHTPLTDGPESPLA